jgi:hypothetical protein
MMMMMMMRMMMMMMRMMRIMMLMVGWQTLMAWHGAAWGLTRTDS